MAHSDFIVTTVGAFNREKVLVSRGLLRDCETDGSLTAIISVEAAVSPLLPVPEVMPVLSSQTGRSRKYKIGKLRQHPREESRR